MNTGDAVLVRMAVPNGVVWKPATILASYPREFHRREYEVDIDGKRVMVSDLSVKPRRT